ncbi:MAG: DNA-methyltransferase [Akkermansia sp.]
MERAPRNRTLTVSDEERHRYAAQLLSLSAPVHPEEIMGKTINQDLLCALPFLPREFADLIVVDPPYNLSKKYGDLSFKTMSDDDYEAYVMSWLPQVVACMKPNGSLYVCCDWKSSYIIYRCLLTLLTVKNRITWQREKGRGAKNNWKNSMEDIWFCVRNDKDYYFDVEAVKQKRRILAPYRVDGKPKDWEESEEGRFRLTFPSNLWDDISIPYWSMPENTDHPTQKPEKLLAKLILASCPPGGVVFDPFLGSGTSSVVAKKLGRRYCGVEINSEYCVWCQKRLAMAELDSRIQGYSGGVFWERNSLAAQKREQALAE